MLEKLRGTHIEVNSIKREYIELFMSELKLRRGMVEKIKEVRLFGSVLTERCRPDSDIDICIILKDGENSYNFRLKYLSKFMIDIYALGFDTESDRLVFTESEYKAEIGRNGVVDDIEKTSKIIYKGSE